jgi:nucleotide-binding universal stress UspA family protein
MTSLYRKILVPYDFSLPSCKALEHSIKIAKLCKKESSSVEIIMLCILEEIQVPPSFDYGMKIISPGVEVKTTKQYLKEVYHDIKTKTLEMLSEKKKVLQTEGISIVTQVSVGKPHQQIIDFAFSKKVDLIVIGASSLRGIQKIRTIGSVSRRVAEEAGCPVMIIH